MTITSRNSVFIIGAGTSAPFGMPLGADLIPQIRGSLATELDSFDALVSKGTHEALGWLKSAATRCAGFEQYPILGTISRQFLNADQRTFDTGELEKCFMKARQLVKLLHHQTSETIDDFIVENPSVAKITKLAIAAIFFRICYQHKDDIYIPRDFESRELPHRGSKSQVRNWVHLLINIVRQGIRSGEVSEQNKVVIVTFNYDSVLERVLRKQFSNTEANYGHYTNFIQILHVHGKCGDIEGSCNNPAETCASWGNNINVVNETTDNPEVNEARLAARELIARAEEIYACGFSFSGPNCRLLGIGSPNPAVDSRTITFCNYDGNVGISKAVENFENKFVAPPFGRHETSTYIEEVAGTPEKPLAIHDWLKLGYLGELPG
jgi:hypothetical protein